MSTQIPLSSLQKILKFVFILCEFYCSIAATAFGVVPGRGRPAAGISRGKAFYSALYVYSNQQHTASFGP